MVAACLSLQKTVKDLKKHVRELTDRVALLEGEVCVLKLSREEINSTSCSKPKVSNVAKPNSQKVVAEVHRDIDGNVQQFIKTASDNNNDIQDALSIPEENILRKRKRPPTLKVRAATEPDSHESRLIVKSVHVWFMLEGYQRILQRPPFAHTLMIYL